jgi:hypothetical protein
LKVLNSISSKDSKKAEQERKLFSLFAKENGWPHGPELIECRSPPEPDILYQRGVGKIAFELAEICDSDLAALSARSIAQGGGSAGIWTGDPTESIIRSKLNKQYNSQFPIELLCYVDGRTVSPDDLICYAIKSELAKADSILFRRIWLFGEKNVYTVFESGNS